MLQGTPGTKPRLTIGIRPAEAFFCAEEHYPKLGVCHIPLTADVFLLTAFQIKTPKDCLIALGEFSQPQVDCLAHLENFRIGERFAANAAAIFQDDVPADAVHKRAELFGVVSNLALAARAHKTRES